jgi:Protein of unknown function (DUF2878)
MKMNTLINRSNSALLLNLIAFQLAWLANIAGPVQLGLLISVGCLVLHFFVLRVWLFDTTERLKHEAIWILAVVFLGWLVESLLFFTSVLKMEMIELGVGQIPLWLIFIWACFATTFRLSMNFFVRHPLWAFFAGSFATLSYAGGVAMNPTVAFGRDAFSALVIIACVWSVLFAGMCEVYRRYWERY